MLRLENFVDGQVDDKSINNKELIHEKTLGINESFKQERLKNTLPALEIKNSVNWINPAFEATLPFDLKNGKNSDLGIFLTPNPQEYPEEQAKQMVVMPEKISGRAVSLDNTSFQDKDGNMYRDIDLKGTGTFLRTPDGGYVVGEVSKRLNDPKQAKGLQDFNIANADKDCTEMFLEKGVRTHRVLAIIDLEEIIDNTGKKITIQEAKDRGIISASMHPVIEVRAFATKERLDYLHGINDNKNELSRAKASLIDAKSVVAQELNKNPDNFSIKEYLEWFAITLGSQIARIKNIGAYHGHLHQQNITLDCRITDLEGILAVNKIMEMKQIYEELKKHLNEETLTPEIIYQSEYDGAKKSLNSFFQDVELLTKEINEDDIEKLLNLYKASYENEIS